MNPVIIRGASREEILAAPPVLLGFHPRESVVLLLLDAGVVACCIRVDLDWFAHDFFPVSSQLERAASQVPEAALVLIGYGADEDGVRLAMDELLSVVGHGRRTDEFLLRDGSFLCLCGDCEEAPFQFENTGLAAQAVYEGIRIEPDRDTAVAPVLLHHPVCDDDALRALEEAAALSERRAMRRTRELAERPGPLTAHEALILGTLLGDEERQSALAQRLLGRSVGPEIGDRIWEHLAQARAVVPDHLVGDVLGLLALASWITGRGAAHSCCLEQLALVDPWNPFGLFAAQVHREATSPRTFRAGRRPR